MIKTLSLILVICILSTSCNQERQPCLTPKIASFNIVCVHHVTDTSTIPTDTALPAATFRALTQNTPLPAYLAYPQSATFTISLASNADSCAWEFTTDSLKNPIDTLKFYYKRQLQFLSNACGFAYFYNLDSFRITHYNIDSARILANSITNDVKTTQFEIYIHPDY